MTERGPDWYRKASEDVFRGRDTPDAHALLDEARTDYRNGRSRTEIAAALKAKGATKGPHWVALKAGRLELPFIIKAASTDFEAGLGDTPNIVRAREAAADLATNDFKLAPQLRALGASDALVLHLDVHPKVKASRRQMSFVFFGLAGAGVLAALIFIPMQGDWQGVGVFGAMMAALFVFFGIGRLFEK